MIFSKLIYHNQYTSSKGFLVIKSFLKLDKPKNSFKSKYVIVYPVNLFIFYFWERFSKHAFLFIRRTTSELSKCFTNHMTNFRTKQRKKNVSKIKK